MRRRAAALLVLLLSGCGTSGAPGASSGPIAEPLPSGTPAPPSMARDLGFAREAISGDRARSTVAFMDSLYRVPGNRGFDASIARVVEALEDAGYEEETSAPSAPLTYRVESRELPGPTWEPVTASLAVVGTDSPLMELATNLNLVAAYSYSTPQGGLEAELVDVGGGSAQDFEGVEVEGKIVLGDAGVRQLFRSAVQERGALGVLAYRIPAFNRPETHRQVAPMSSIPHDAESRAWGLLLSLEARDALRDALSAGPVLVHVDVQTRVYPSSERTLVAEVRGASYPAERFVLSAHVQESGANDNASGVAVLSEVARAFGEGVSRGSFRPERTITMIWGDEISSTRRYLEEDGARAEGVRWGLSLDMVGEDTEKTGGTFLIEKMPDPSAVWTRGADRHTEWGGRPLTLDQMFAHYFNDFLLNRCLDQARGTGWVVRTNPYEGGSDHVPFLRAGVPGVLFWHFTDVFYHTDGDRVEMVSPATLANVGVSAAYSAMTLTTADGEVATFIIGELERAALERLAVERDLSEAAVAGGGDRAREALIVRTWTEWYLGALDTTTDIQVGGSSPWVLERLASARRRVAEAGRAAMEGFGPTFPDRVPGAIIP